MWLHPNDLARIGYLYLNNGSWEDQSIVSQDWINMSVSPHDASGYAYLQEKKD